MWRILFHCQLTTSLYFLYRYQQLLAKEAFYTPLFSMNTAFDGVSMIVQKEDDGRQVLANHG